MAGAHGGSRWTDELLNRMREQGDPVADDVMKAVFEQGDVDAANAVMRTLVSNDQPVPASLPQQIQDYLATDVALPFWADPGKIKRGQQLFEPGDCRFRSVCSALLCRRHTRRPRA